MTRPREDRRQPTDGEQPDRVDRRALRRSLGALRVLRDRLDADPATRRVPAEYASEAATHALLEQVRTEALHDLEQRAATQGWSGELAATSMPSRLRFQERRMLEELVGDLGDAARARLARRTDGAVEAELSRPLHLPEDAPAVDPPAGDPLPAEAVPDYTPDWTRHLEAEQSLARSATAEAGGRPRTPGWLWARIREDVRTLRRAHRFDRRMRVASRVALVAALVLVTVVLWPHAEQADPRSRIEIIQTDQPLSESYSALAVMRGLHDDSR